MTAAQGTGTGAPEAQEYAGELGGFVLARSAVDRVSIRRGDSEWLAAAWADPGTGVLVLDNDRALVRFGDKEAELVLVPPARAPEGLRFLLGVDDAGVAYFGVMGPPGCLEPLLTDAGEPAAGTPARGHEAPGQGAGQEAPDEPPEAQPAEAQPPEAQPPEAQPPEAQPPEAQPPEAQPEPARRASNRKPSHPRSRKPPARTPPSSRP